MEKIYSFEGENAHQKKTYLSLYEKLKQKITFKKILKNTELFSDRLYLRLNSDSRTSKKGLFKVYAKGKGNS